MSVSTKLGGGGPRSVIGNLRGNQRKTEAAMYLEAVSQDGGTMLDNKSLSSYSPVKKPRTNRPHLKPSLKPLKKQ